MIKIKIQQKSEDRERNFQLSEVIIQLEVKFKSRVFEKIFQNFPLLIFL